MSGRHPRLPVIIRRPDLDTVYQFKWYAVFFIVPIIIAALT